MRKVFRQKDTQLQQLLREVRYVSALCGVHSRAGSPRSQCSTSMRWSRLPFARADLLPVTKRTRSSRSKARSCLSSSFTPRLFAHNRHVDQYNQQKLDALLSPAVEFVGEDAGGRAFRQVVSRSRFVSCPAEQSLPGTCAPCAEAWCAGDAAEEPVGRGRTR